MQLGLIKNIQNQMIAICICIMGMDIAIVLVMELTHA